MKTITEEQFAKIAHLFPVQRGNVSCRNLDVLNALLYVLVNGCTWRGLPKEFGCWHTIYTRISRWMKARVIERVFTALQQERFLKIDVTVMSLDCTSIKVHPDGFGALKKKKAIHREKSWRLEHQTSSGYRG